MKMNTENEDGGEEIEHLKQIIEVSAKELEKKEEELNAAKECIEIILDKLKRNLVNKFVEIMQSEVNERIGEAWEMFKNNILEF